MGSIFYKLVRGSPGSWILASKLHSPRPVAAPLVLYAFFFCINGVDRPGDAHRVVSRNRVGEEERVEIAAGEEKRGKKKVKRKQNCPICINEPEGYMHWEKKKRWQILQGENWRKGNIKKRKTNTAGWGFFIL